MFNLFSWFTPAVVPFLPDKSDHNLTNIMHIMRDISKNDITFESLIIRISI